MTLENINTNIDSKINSLLEKTSKKEKKILVLSGGGIKGIAHIGALKALENMKILQNIKIFVGNSIGGLVSSMYVVGYTIDELYDFIETFNLKKFRSTNLDPSNIFTKFGIDSGDRFVIILKKMIEAKNLNPEITFKELYEKTKLKIILVGSCLNDKTAHYFSHESHPDMPLWIGIRITTSVPIWFMPVEYKNKIYVDGGCIDNYPIGLFQNDLDSVIGLYLSEHREYIKNIPNTEEFLMALIQTLQEGVTCKSIMGYEKYTVLILVQQIIFTNLDITLKIKKQLFSAGYTAVTNYFTKE